MEIYQAPYGPLSSNMYIVTTEEAVFIIDPSCSPRILENTIDLDKISAIFITHGHFDHIFAIEEYIKRFPNIKVFMSVEDKRLVKEGYLNGSDLISQDISYNFEFEDSRYFKAKDFDTIKVTSFETPGHTRGSICYLFEDSTEKALFTGDTLFRNGMGRTDLPSGNDSDMMNSLAFLKKLPADYVVYPGHGQSSTIGNEVKNNPYFF